MISNENKFQVLNIGEVSSSIPLFFDKRKKHLSKTISKMIIFFTRLVIKSKPLKNQISQTSFSTMRLLKIVPNFCICCHIS